jgi:hypothetical protein
VSNTPLIVLLPALWVLLEFSGVTVVLQWCYSGVTVVLQWCYSGGYNSVGNVIRRRSANKQALNIALFHPQNKGQRTSFSSLAVR